jgi:DNA-binding transcriptional MerR regulator
VRGTGKPQAESREGLSLSDIFPLVPLIPAAEPEKAKATPRKNRAKEPDRPGIKSPAALGLIPTHELINMANALGIDVDYNTLRFWQKRGLVSRPVRGPVDSGRGTRGYYDASLIDRLAFIRQIQKTYAMGLDEIRAELDRIDRLNAAAGTGYSADVYENRLIELRTQHENESKKTLLNLLTKVLGLSADGIETITIRKRDGQSIQFSPEKEGGTGEKEADLRKFNKSSLF